jgi:hypothetical protein
LVCEGRGRGTPRSQVNGSEVENRLVSASGAKTASLAYDPLERLWETSGGTAGTTRFLYDGDRLIVEYDTAGSPLRVYLHGPGADDPLVWWEVVSSTVGHRFLKADHQGSIVAAADSYGNPVAINAYDSWGIPNAGNQGRFGYTGQAWIPERGARPAVERAEGRSRSAGQRPFFCRCLSRSSTMLPSPSGSRPSLRATS